MPHYDRCKSTNHLRVHQTPIRRTWYQDLSSTKGTDLPSIYNATQRMPIERTLPFAPYLIRMLTHKLTRYSFIGKLSLSTTCGLYLLLHDRDDQAVALVDRERAERESDSQASCPHSSHRAKRSDLGARLRRKNPAQRLVRPRGSAKA